MLLAVLSGVAIWVLDSLLDYFLFFPERSFWGVLIADIPRGKLPIRLAAVSGLIVFGAIMAVVFSRSRPGRVGFGAKNSPAIGEKPDNADRQVEESLELHRFILGSLSEAVLVADDRGFVTYVSPNSEAVLGYSPLEVQKLQTIQNLLGVEQYQKIFGKKPVENRTVEYEYTDKFGQRRPLMITTAEVRLGRGMMYICRDNSEHKAATEALEASESRLAQIVEGSPVPALVIDRNHVITHWNLACANLTGLKAEEMVGTDRQWSAFYSSQRPILADLIVDQASENKIEELYKGKYQKSRVVAGGYEATDYFSDLAGHKKWLFFTAGPLRNSDGEIIGAIETLQDITETKHAAMELAAEKERLAVTLRSIGDGVIVTDISGRVISLNHMAELILRWEEAEVIGQPLNNIFHIINGETRQRCEDPIARVLRTGRATILADNTILIPREGPERIIADSGSPIRDHSGQVIGVVLVFRDVTEKVHLEEFASRAQRLETAGRIAGQVAHDFNNLLGPLTAYPALIRERLPADHSAIDLLIQIERSALQMADINQQLLTLGRRGHYTLQPINLNTVVSQVARQFYSLSETVTIETDLSSDLFYIKGGSSQIYRVISNLISNAVDATGEVGRVVIKTENFYVDSRIGKFEHIPRGEYVKVTVADNGSGIAPDVMPRIFEPFYSTKTQEGKRGSGLGLSVVHSVVEDHGGYIDFETEPGRGTSFYLYFPITRESVETAATEQLSGGSESILVVDDDFVQLEVTRILLEKLGYKVSKASSGEQAVEMLKVRHYDLVVLDMIMPGGMDGTETYRRALELHPGQKAIIVSGFAESHRVEEAIQLGAGLFLRKPLTLKSIAKAAREILDEVSISGSGGKS